MVLFNEFTGVVQRTIEQEKKPSTNKGLDCLFDISVEKVQKAIINMNDKYTFTLLDGYVEKDILVAKIIE